ncbi:hypothetical protein LR48_Vigan03g091100 [Vigna angularis]|uniref:Uncharacterized protein n=1 Tax=Phaseolus angularis TaxID=3914 RepID=A0A0L9U558_PHAAN|nr:hypothetical protein LR48_Vigan03g091100 [Vigna angularis]
MKQKSDSRLPLSEGGDPPPPPSPPSRHDKWKLARIRPSGSYTSKSAREISERIVEAVKEVVQLPVPQGTTWMKLVHCMVYNFSEDEFKVRVDEVVIADAVLPVPTDEFFIVEEAW